MGTVYINARCKKILYLLLTHDNYMSLQQIAKETGVSKRSIYYDLCKINELLTSYHIPELEVVRGKGILISAENKKQIESIVENEQGEESYIFSPTERVKIIICYIIHNPEATYIEQLSDYCEVSRNTIFNDLRVVVNQLQDYNLTLYYESKKGYHIVGDVIRIRALFFLYFNTLLPLFDSGVLTFIKREDLNIYWSKLKSIEKELNTTYVDGILFSLSALLSVIYNNSTDEPYFPNLKKEELVKTTEFQLVQKYFPDLKETEQTYICLHLLGSRIAAPTNDIFEDNSNESVYEITKALVSEFEKIACVIFEEREELERALFVHINTSLYRYQYGIQIGEDMTDDVIREYPNLFDITKLASKYLEQLVGLPIPDNEVAYLALHFGAHLKISRSLNEQLRILIVCVNGISTGNMLKREVQKLLPHAKIVDVVAAIDVINIQEICDLVISTVKIKSVVPTITVHPILTDFDRKTILNHHLVAKRKQLMESDALFDIIKKYVNEDDYANLKLDLSKYFQGNLNGFGLPFSEEPLGLIEILAEDRIQITSKTFSWTEAIRFSGKLLLEMNSIERRYLDNIIAQIRYYGPYMFIAPGLMLAHAKPEDGVKSLDVTLTVFQKPVQFSEFHEARLIITLAAEDQEKHLKILKDIMTIFSIQSRVDEIASLSTKESILQYMKHIITQK
ncbi:putative licABCH operon regulator [Clostridiales bacterium CHKCI001]|nr:putative licABCH operon regulator [Clostridiales bacterium CHKCI001]